MDRQIDHYLSDGIFRATDIILFGQRNKFSNLQNRQNQLVATDDIM